MKITSSKIRKYAVFVGLFAAATAGVVWAQQALPDLGGEITSAQSSWPNEVKGTVNGADKTMGQLLAAIVSQGLIELARPETTEPVKVNIRLSINRALACAAYDGYAPVDPNSPPVPLPVHNQKFGTLPSKAAHQGAKAKVIAAYNAVFPTPPGTVDWQTCSDELNHGH